MPERRPAWLRQHRRRRDLPSAPPSSSIDWRRRLLALPQPSLLPLTPSLRVPRLSEPQVRMCQAAREFFAYCSDFLSVPLEDEAAKVLISVSSDVSSNAESASEATPPRTTHQGFSKRQAITNEFFYHASKFLAIRSKSGRSGGVPSRAEEGVGQSGAVGGVDGAWCLYEGRGDGRRTRRGPSPCSAACIPCLVVVVVSRNFLNPGPVYILLKMAAAVGFDAAEQKFVVVEDEAILDGLEEGSTLDHNGHSLTLLQLCTDADEARNACEEKAATMTNINGLGLTQITYDDDPSHSSVDGSMEETHLETESVNEDGSIAQDTSADPVLDPKSSAPNNGLLSLLADFQQQIDDNAKNVQDMVVLMMNDINTDMERIHQRQASLRNFFIERFGMGGDGRLAEPFASDLAASRERLFNVGTTMAARTMNRVERAMTSYFDEAERACRKRQMSSVNLVRNSKRSRLDDDDDFEEDEEALTRRTNNNGIGRACDVLTYPYISKEMEERIHRTSNGSASIYAQKLGREVFADSLDLYFKDQDPKRRQWLHEAVDFRFPSEDKPAQLLKWKNCSYAINKNMRISVGHKRSPNSSEEPLRDIDENQAPTSLGIKFIYPQVTPEYEKECYSKSKKDPNKYAEIMALRLFSDCLDLFFKDQDQKRKDWLRECVDKRFSHPDEDKQKKDQRWKNCAVACNRNRTKVIGDDGHEKEFPYFPREFEEDFFRKSNGIPSQYIELMYKKLFPSTQHMYLKDQDLGKRNWLHQCLEKRFPSRDKAEHAAKWKSCTNAIAKLLHNGGSSSVTTTPVAPPVQPSRRSEPAPIKEKTPLKELPIVKEPPPRFDRRSALERVRETSEASKTPQTNASRTGGPSLRSDDNANKRESVRLNNQKMKKEKESFVSYPYVTEEEEIEILEKCNENPQVYARELGKLLFKDTIKLYYKDQDPDRRGWMREIVDFRFPSKNAMLQKQKWKNVSAAINRNMTAAFNGRKSTSSTR
ncbi:unnamed protein product [Caenorhabditis auriculariae]|uniref:Uncharacterized protein n=1 Tax=Caenorhabditis auriculariae TaxID=2777116 RepID=A0A8S1H922_9PELO|nr:unnamed protein product [Caenorhabditis auriculariae]